MLLITGATGFLGTYLRQTIHLPYLGISSRLSSENNITNANLLDIHQLQPIFHAHKISHIIHLAAITYNTQDQNFDGNISMMQNLIQSALPQKIPLTYVSTFAATYKDDPYAKSKRDAEKLLKNSNLPHTILRPTMIIGPGSKDLALFQKLARFNVLPLVNGGNQLIQPIQVDQVTKWLTYFLTNPPTGKTHILSGARPLTTKELLLSLNSNLKILHIPPVLIQNKLTKKFPKFYELTKTFTNDLIPKKLPIQILEKQLQFDSLAYTIK